MTKGAPLFGSEIIQLLVPHRRPFLMVDAVDAFDRDAHSLRAHRMISANEDVFAGHFPGLNLWPGVYTIEGLGQSCLLLAILQRFDEPTLAALTNLQRGYRLDPAYRPAAAIDLGPASARMGVGAAVDVELVAPVFAGQCLEYRVRRTHVVGDLTRFDVEALVDARTVARGVMTGKSNVLVPDVLP